MRKNLLALALLVLSAASARATPITGSINAAQGTVSGTMTAGHFSGDGSLLTNVSPSLSTVTVQLQAVAASTTALSASTAAIQAQFTAETTAVAASTNALSASTASLAGVVSALGVSTAALSASTVALAAQFVTDSSSWTNTSANGVKVVSSVTAGAFFGDGSHIDGVVKSITGNDAIQSIGNYVVLLSLNPSSATLQGNTFNGTSQLVQTTGGGVLPALGAANLTSLTPGNISAGVATNVTGLGAQAQALNLNSHLLNNVTDPVSSQDGATKIYVDSNLSAGQTKASCRLVTVAPLPTNVYSNGSSGVGATLTGLSIGALTVDGVVAQVGNRLLINNEATAAQDGIYTVTQNSALVVYILTRATDHDSPAEMPAGVSVYVTSGTAAIASSWLQISSVTTVGTDSAQFTETSGVSEIVAGAGLLKSTTTSTLSVDSSSVAFFNASGFIPNAKHDSSSVTLRGNAWPASVDTSTTALSASTTTMATAVSGLAASTTTLSASTVTLAGIVSTLGVSTAALSASTVTLQTAATNLAASTTTLSASTVTLATAVSGLAASTTTLSASTVTLAGIVSTLGVSTATLSTSTAALASVKASTGTNTDIVATTALRSVGGVALTVTSSATFSDVTNGVSVVSSVTAGAFFGNGGNLSGVYNLYNAPLRNASFINTYISSTAMVSNSTTTIYTVPANRRAVFAAILFFNTTIASIGANTVRFSSNSTGTSFRMSGLVTVASSTTANGFTTQQGIVLESGEMIRAYVSAAGITVKAKVIEFDNTSALVPAHSYITSAGDNTLYQVPTGKSSFIFDGGANSEELSRVVCSNDSGSSMSYKVYAPVPSALPSALGYILTIAAGTAIGTGTISQATPNNTLPTMASGDKIIITSGSTTAPQFCFVNMVEL